MKRITDHALLALLDNSPERLERHLQRHPDDVQRLEYLTELPAQQRLAVGLTVQAPDDIAQRVAARMRVDPALREAGATFAGLLTLGFETARVVLESASPNERIGS